MERVTAGGHEAAGLLAGRVGSYGYVSSGSVYVWGSHVDETSPVADGDPQTEDGAYPALERGAEPGVLAAFPDALLARPEYSSARTRTSAGWPRGCTASPAVERWSLLDAHPAHCSSSTCATWPRGC